MGTKMTGRVVPIARVSETQRRQMYAVFERYYEAVDFETFERDLASKDYVILLFDGGGTIGGFSTMKHLELHRDGKLHRGLFSGDTVVAEEFWGQRVLGRLFLRHLLLQKLKRPLEPYWWFLISKGYKTYLLMANNFAEHYPRFEGQTSAEAQALLDGFAATLYPNDYRRERGTIEFDQSHGQLKRGIAGITSEMLGNPRIQFFQERNPGWSQGHELACIARMTLAMPAYYAAKAVIKKWGRLGHRLAPLPPVARD